MPLTKSSSHVTLTWRLRGSLTKKINGTKLKTKKIKQNIRDPHVSQTKKIGPTCQWFPLLPPHPLPLFSNLLLGVHPPSFPAPMAAARARGRGAQQGRRARRAAREEQCATSGESGAAALRGGGGMAIGEKGNDRREGARRWARCHRARPLWGGLGTSAPASPSGLLSSRRGEAKHQTHDNHGDLGPLPSMMDPRASQSWIPSRRVS